MGRRSSNPLNLWEFKYKITTSTPVDAEQIAIDSNWAFDHAALMQAHGISAFGASLVDDADAATARGTLGLGSAAVEDVGYFATAAQGALADTALQPGEVPTNAGNLPWSDALYGIGESYAQGAIDYILTILQETHEPTGFPNKTDSGLSKVDGTRTFSITPSGADFDYYLSGVKKTVSSQQDVVWTATEGMHHFYFDKDGGGLMHTTTFDPLLITEHAYIANLYWDATNNVAIRFGEERHGMNMDSDTHVWMHQTSGSVWISGLSLTNLVVDGNGSSNTHAQLAVVDGVIKDEDITHNITDGSPQTLQSIAQIPVFYLSGAGGVWRKKTADSYPLIYNGTAGYSGTYPAYNEWTGAVWQLTSIGNNNYALVHIFATNDLEEPVIAILGQNVYTSIANARSAANSEINSTVVTGLPSQEFTALATLIVSAKSSYTNTPKGIFVSTDDGSDYIDWRGASYSPSGGIGTGDHGNLAGLGDDDHPHYYNQTRGDARYSQLGHTHAGVYEPIDATIIRQADIDDTPVDAETNAPISSNWAFDHAALTQAHGISAFGASLVDDADAATARSTLGLVIGTNVQAYDANLPTWPSSVSATEVSYLDGVTGAIQTQLNGKIGASGVTYENLSANGDIGTGSTQVSQGSHSHTSLTSMSLVQFSIYNIGNVSGAFTFNGNNGNLQKCTLTGNITSFAVSNLSPGVYYLFLDVGSGPYTWADGSGNLKWEDGGTLPALSTTANDINILMMLVPSTGVPCCFLSNWGNIY